MRESQVEPFNPDGMATKSKSQLLAPDFTLYKQGTENSAYKIFPRGEIDVIREETD